MGDLRIGRTLDIAGELLRKYPKDFFRINLYIFLPVCLVSNLLILLLNPDATPLGQLQQMINQFENPETSVPTGTEFARMMLASGVALLYGGVNMFFVLPVTLAAVTYYAACRYLGRPITPREALRRGFKKYGAYLLVTILYLLILAAVAVVGWIVVVLVAVGGALGAQITVAIPAVIGAAAGVGWLWLLAYVTVRFGLCTTVVMVEDVHDIAALRRSSALTRGRIGRGVWLLVLSYWIIGGLVVGGSAVVPVAWISVALTSVASALTYTFTTLVFTIYYFNCRCLHEDFDIAYLIRNAFPQEQAAPAVAVSAPVGSSAGSSAGGGYRDNEALFRDPAIIDTAIADSAEAGAASERIAADPAAQGSSGIAGYGENGAGTVRAREGGEGEGGRERGENGNG